MLGGAAGGPGNASVKLGVNAYALTFSNKHRRPVLRLKANFELGYTGHNGTGKICEILVKKQNYIC